MRFLGFIFSIIKSWKFILALVGVYLFIAWWYLKDTPTQVTGINLAVILAIPLTLVSMVWLVKRISQKKPAEDKQEKPSLLGLTKKKVETNAWLYIIDSNTVTAMGDDAETLLVELSEETLATPDVDDSLMHPVYMTPVLSQRIDIDDSGLLNHTAYHEADASAETEEETSLDLMSDRVKRIMGLTLVTLDNIQDKLSATIELLPNQKKRQAMEAVDPTLLHHEWLEERLDQPEASFKTSTDSTVHLLKSIKILHIIPSDIDDQSKQSVEKQVVNYFADLGCEQGQVNYDQIGVKTSDDTLCEIVNVFTELYEDSHASVLLVVGADSHLDQAWIDRYMTDTELAVGELGGVLMLANQAFMTALASYSQTELGKDVYVPETQITLPKVMRRTAKLKNSMSVDARAMTNALKDIEERYHDDLAYLSTGKKTEDESLSTDTQSNENKENTDSTDEKSDKIVYYLSDINKAKQPAHINEFQAFKEHAHAEEILPDLNVSQWVTCGEAGESSQLITPLVTLALAVDCPREAGYTKVMCHAGDWCRSVFVLYNNDNPVAGSERDVLS